MARLLDSINSPEDLRRLDRGELAALAAELREEIIEVVSSNGGHLSASLGVVELVITLHYLFDTPQDRLVFDVGHQAYAHKLLTGRREKFRTLRKFGGCAGFPASWESACDVGASGHAGVAVSTALGIAAANQLAGRNDRAIAVVGDGALNCGISIEGLNNARRDGKNLIVVLNDNKMSIARNVGGLAHFLNGLVINRRYNRFKDATKRALRNLPGYGGFYRFVNRVEGLIKGLIVPGQVFEKLGFRYLGPINGHSLPDLLYAFERIREMEGPILVHVVTRKGHGCDFARRNPENYHGVSGFDRESGKITTRTGSTFSGAFGSSMVRLAKEHDELVAVSAAMVAGTGLAGFQMEHPDRCYDVGIAEEHAVVFSAGLASAGRRPVCAIYATFMQRALDCVYHDVVLPGLPVIFALDRAGVVEDGPTHHGIYDLGFLRAMPGLTILAPANEAELGVMLEYAYSLARPVVIRYPRGGSPEPEAVVTPLEMGRARVMRQGDGAVVIWAMGPEVYTALEVAKQLEKELGIGATVVNARFLSPFDRELALELAAGKLTVSIENHALTGGLASALDEVLRGTGGDRLAFGWPDRMIPHGSEMELKEAEGLTAEKIAKKIVLALKKS